MATITATEKKGKKAYTVKPWDHTDMFVWFLHGIGLTPEGVFEEIKKDVEGKKIYEILQDFALYMSFTGVGGTSQKTYMAHVKQFLTLNTFVDITPTKFRLFVKPLMASPESDDDAILSSSDIARIISVQPQKIQLICMLEICSLRRPKELNKLKVSNFKFDTDPVQVIVPAAVSKNHKQGHTFLTPECAKTLKAYITKHELKDDDLIFGYTSKVGMSKIFNDNLRRHLPDLCERKNNKRFTIRLYSMKKYGYGQIELAVSRDFAMFLKGDKKQNESEYSMVEQQKRIEQYKKCIPFLTIFNQDELQQKIQSKNTEESAKITALYERIKQLEQEKAGLESRLDDKIKVSVDKAIEMALRGQPIAELKQKGWISGEYKHKTTEFPDGSSITEPDKSSVRVNKEKIKKDLGLEEK